MSLSFEKLPSALTGVDTFAGSLPSKMACLSQGFARLMESRNIRVVFSQVSADGVCFADATQNPTNAYKVRGALASASMAMLEGQGTLVTASAGNHGAGLAYAARLLGLRAVIYVPTSAPEVKLERIKSFGAEIRPIGATFDECLGYALNDCGVRAGEAKFVHPFDDLVVAAGQGTIGLEMLALGTQEIRARRFDTMRVFLPIGGGGLAAGILSALRTCWPTDLPSPEIIGVVDESSPAALLAILRGHRVRAIPDTIADGTKVAVVGDTFLALAPLLDGLMLVPHDEIVSAMRSYEVRTFVRLEGAGALGVAGEVVARRYNLCQDSQRVLSVPLITGTNIDPEVFHAEVVAEARMDSQLLKRQGYEVLVPEEAGQLLKFLRLVRGYNIAGLTYQAREGERMGRLRVEFEVRHSEESELLAVISQEFPGSRSMRDGEQMLYEVTKVTDCRAREELVSLEDRPGTFLRYVEELSAQGRFGSVHFLFYRKPAQSGAKGQVVLSKG